MNLQTLQHEANMSPRDHQGRHRPNYLFNFSLCKIMFLLRIRFLQGVVLKLGKYIGKRSVN